MKRLPSVLLLLSLLVFLLLSIRIGIDIVKNFSEILKTPVMLTVPIVFIIAIGLVVWAIREIRKLQIN